MEPTKQQSTSTLFSTLRIAWGFGYTIVIPLVVLALLGRLIDKHWNTSPWGLIVGIIVSIVLSSIALVMKFSKLMAEINAESKNATKPESNNQKPSV